MADTSYDEPQDIGTGPKGVYRRWMMEITLSEKRDKDWHKISQDIIKRYRAKDIKKNSFNILWANTETVAPAIFNSTPKPDVRRRYRDEDLVGNVVSELLGRDLEFCLDNDTFQHSIQMDVMDMLLPGRGVSRVRYVPSLTEKIPQDDGEESLEGSQEEVAWEAAVIEHVQWDRFRMGPGKTWEQVQWIGYEHWLNKEELKEKFGEEIASNIVMDDLQDEELRKQDDQLKTVFSTAQVWEIWDKDKKEIIFLSPGYRDGPLQTLDDPLQLEGFFDVPRPLYAIFDASSLNPVPLYAQYREQAQELDNLTKRIAVITNGLKLRGMYDSTMAEIDSLMRGDDNQMIAVQNVAAMYEKGGLEKAVTWMPIDQAAAVLVQLMQQREQCKQTIYELCGIPDIARGASDPNETLGAQQIKIQFSGARISNMQREVQRYIRDLVRLMGEIIGEHFSAETVMGMANMELPTDAQQAQQMMAYQQQAQQAQMMAQQTGQPPQIPPPPQPQVTIDQCMKVMRDDLQRCYKIDIETDSTIAASITEDMAGLQNVLQGISQFMETAAPAVQAGVIPFDAAKEIVMTICRRAKLGNAVESAMDKMTAPAKPDPSQNPDAIKAQTEMAKIQAKAKADAVALQQEAQFEQFKANLLDQQHQRELQQKAIAEQRSAELQAQLQAHEQQVQAQQNQHQNELEAQREAMKSQQDAALEQMRIASEERMHAIEQHMATLIASQNNETKIIVAEIGAASVESAAQTTAAQTATEYLAR